MLRPLVIPHAAIRAALGVLFLCVSALAALADGRVALLIGNSRYVNSELDLKNPVNDVTALGAELRGLGFVVTEATNLTREAMEGAIANFGRAANGAEIALVFYAGHGVQAGGENYLVATDFADPTPQGLTDTAVTMTRLRQTLEAAAPDIGIVILDACRDNPFAAAGVVERGLSRVRGGARLLFAYATDPGNVAYDGSGDNSVFTTALLDQIGTPGIDLRIMFGRVRQDVVLKSGGRQIPWVEESVLGEFYLAGAEPPERISDAYASELDSWRAIFSSREIADFEGFLQRFPDGLFASFARDRIALLRESGGTAPASTETLVAEAEPAPLAAALESLGFLSTRRSVDSVERAELVPPLDNWAAGLPDGDAPSLERLYGDATRSSVYVAATMAQRIRTDLVALSSVEKTITIAEDAVRDIATIAEADPAAKPVLEAAQQDLGAIRTARETILMRLDRSRTYYDELLRRSTLFVPPGTTAEVIGGQSLGRGIGEVEERLFADAELFLRHVAEAPAQPEGSYAWLTDFLPAR